MTTVIIMRLLDDAGMHTTGEGRCLVTDNWYSTFKLMRLIWLTFKMLLIGTFTPTKKRSRTADDYPFPKLSNGAMKKIPQGWTRIAFQNAMTEKDVHRDAAKRKPLYTVQATIWKDKRCVGMIHNYDVKELDDGDPHYVDRYSPSKKGKKKVESPTVIRSYAESYNGVDHKDRDTSDWTSTSLKAGRWYMRLFYWMLDSVVFCVFLIVTHQAKGNKQHAWYKYTKRDGRRKFQLDLAHSLIERGISEECRANGVTDMKLLRDPKKRPSFMRKDGFVPCDCGICFFCKHNLTHGVDHKAFYRSRGYQAPAPVGSKPLNQHATERQHISRSKRGRCVVCVKESKAANIDKKTQNQLREEGQIAQIRVGCPDCDGGKGLFVCKNHWNDFGHQL